MIGISKNSAVALGSLLLAVATLSAAPSAVPGTVNYVEGQVTLEGQTLSPQALGSVIVNKNEVLSTSAGKAEVLLTPGVFLRVGDHSSIQMVSSGLANTQVSVLSGRAMLEADEVLKDNNIQVAEDGLSARIEKNGLYEFDADRKSVAVFDGKANVREGDQHIELKKGHEVLLAGPLRAQKFDRHQHDSLFAWSNLRSEYVAEAGAQSARGIVVNEGAWGGPGWYWNPYWDMYSFVPGAGILYSPFGWGLYSPGFVYSYYPGLYGGYGRYGHSSAIGRFGGQRPVGGGFNHTFAGNRGGFSGGHASAGGGGFGGRGGFGGGHR